MRADTDNMKIGIVGERRVLEYLKTDYPETWYYSWMRPMRNNHPFDIVIADENAKLIALFEVKAFGHARKGMWTTFTRRAIRRKKAWAKKYAPGALMFTVCPVLHKDGQLSRIVAFEGFPSRPLDEAMHMMGAYALMRLHEHEKSKKNR